MTDRCYRCAKADFKNPSKRQMGGFANCLPLKQAYHYKPACHVCSNGKFEPDLPEVMAVRKRFFGSLGKSFDARILRRSLPQKESSKGVRKKMTHDSVNHPNHYTQQPHECIEFTEHLGFCLGNAFKYAWRAQDKNGVEDLKKARWYLNRVIEQELPLELDNEIWAVGNGKLAECGFSGEQEQILRTLWFLAQGVGAWRVYEDLGDVAGHISLWIAKLEAESETGIAPVA